MKLAHNFSVQKMAKRKRGGGSGSPILITPSYEYPRSTATWVLFLLASLHLSSELGHFLIGVVSKYVARDLHYGTHACFPSKSVPGIVVRGVEGVSSTTDQYYHRRLNAFNASECLAARNQTECESIVSNDGSTHACHWDWTGLGTEYQFIAGPSFMAVFTICSILWGVLADKYDRVYILFTSAMVFSMALIMTSVSTKFWHLVALRMVLAAGVAGIAPIAPGIIFDMFSPQERGLAMGLFHWGMYAGNGLTFVVGKYVTEMNIFNAGWRSTFVLCGMPGALLAIIALFTVEDPPKAQRKISLSSLHCHHSFADGNDNQEEDEEEEDEEDEDKQEETEVIEDCCDTIDEAQVLISNGGTSDNHHHHQISKSNKSLSSSSVTSIITSSGGESWRGGRGCLNEPVVYILGLGACLRHSAGYTWGYNSALYFQTYYPSNTNASIWLTWITIFGGSFGVILGGFLSDRLVSRLGMASRALVLAASQIIATPFALGLLYLQPPAAFLSLFVGFLFAEMWYSVVFAILVELLPTKHRSMGLAISLFVVNNVGGNLPIIVTPLSSLFGFRGALTILYPGALLVSSVLFFMTYILLRRRK